MKYQKREKNHFYVQRILEQIFGNKFFEIYHCPPKSQTGTRSVERVTVNERGKIRTNLSEQKWNYRKKEKRITDNADHVQQQI